MSQGIRQFIGIMLFCLTLIPAIISGGCATTGGEIFAETEIAQVWPKPPDKPRITYVGQISTEEDLKKTKEFGEGLAELIFGKKDIGTLVSPVDVVVDEDSRLYIADNAGAAIHIFDLSGRKYSQFSATEGKQNLKMPVALSLIDNRLYIVDSVLHGIYVFDKKGKFIRSFGHDILERPSGIAYSASSQKLFIADTAKHCINVFDKKGTFIKPLGARGNEKGLFNFPTRLWTDSDGKLFVCDTLNYRIQIFTDKGEFISMFGRQGDRPGYFAHPAAVATDRHGHLYVVDRQFENIQVFNDQGHVRMAWGKEGSDPGQFWLPSGIFISEGNRIYVADSFNKRIQVFKFLEELEL